MLRVITKEEAARCVREAARLRIPETETVPLSRSLGRVAAKDLTAGENVPAFDRSTVDGYALCAADTFGAGASMPAELEIVGEIAMGEEAALTLRRGQCARIATGGMLPQGADCAVMIEHTQDAGGLCLVFSPASPGENVTKRGDDLAAGDLVLRRGERLDAARTGALAALGIEAVRVFKKPRVAIISTGDELTKGSLQAGQVRDINSDLLRAAAEQFGCEAICFGAVKDRRELISQALERALATADLVLISGGSSAGAKDMTLDLLAALGTVHFHGIAMKPGKPTIFATVGNKAVFGLPGHPLAAYFVFRLLVCDYLRELLSLPPDRPFTKKKLAVNIPSNHGREEYLCVTFEEADGVLPLHTKSGVISVLLGAKGFIRIDRNTEGLAAGTTVEVFAL